MKNLCKHKGSYIEPGQEYSQNDVLERNPFYLPTQLLATLLDTFIRFNSVYQYNSKQMSQGSL